MNTEHTFVSYISPWYSYSAQILVHCETHHFLWPVSIVIIPMSQLPEKIKLILSIEKKKVVKVI